MHHPDFFRRPHSEGEGPFTSQVIDAACVHARDCAPEEACGFVRGGTYVPCTNVADDPTKTFEIAMPEIGPALLAGEVQGIIHSHVDGPWWPSLADMQGQIETAVPWAIVIPGEPGASAAGQLACWWGGRRPAVFDANGVHQQRTFGHGCADCYDLIRDWWSDERGITLPQFPRVWEWWLDPDTHGEMYLGNLEEAGFHIASTDAATFPQIAEPGDVYLIRIRSKTPNHGGIYLGNGLALEHVQGCLSTVRPIHPLMRHISHWLKFGKGD